MWMHACMYEDARIRALVEEFERAYKALQAVT